MARKLRIQYPGAMYHVMSRGNRREPIFQDDSDRERFLDTLGEYRIPQDSLAGRRRLGEALEARREGVEGSSYKPIRRCLCLGNDCFKQELLTHVAGHAGRYHYGEELRESAEAVAERMVAEELKRRGWDNSTLMTRRKGELDKAAIARRLRGETTMTLAWIADRLHMGTRTHLAHLLYWQERTNKKKYNTLTDPYLCFSRADSLLASAALSW
jgi:hypothetical protein